MIIAYIFFCIGLVTGFLVAIPCTMIAVLWITDRRKNKRRVYG